jgi:hypothetical protein
LFGSLPAKIDNKKSAAYNLSMGGFIQSSPAQEDETNWVPVLVGVAAVVVAVGIILLVWHNQPKGSANPHPYAANVKLSDIKMSAAQNFVGASVTYIDGTVTNAGDKTVIHGVIHVIFRNSMSEVAQGEDVPLRILQLGGPYPDTVDLLSAPLQAGQSKPFRLTFEHVSSDWNQNYPELEVTDVTVK